MKSVKNNARKGISLIVLVITIIIMIILAAVVIIALKEAGIIGTTEKATKEYSEKELTYELSLILSDAVIEKVNNGKDIVKFCEEAEEIDEIVDNNSLTFTVSMRGYLLTVNKATLEIFDISKITAYRKDVSGKAKFVSNSAEGYVVSEELVIEIEEGLTENSIIQYNLVEGTKDSENWVTYTPGTKLTITKNMTVYGRIVNSETNEIGYNFRKEITTIDVLSPKATITLDKTMVLANEAVTATVKQSDDESGINITSCKYLVNGSSEKIGVDNTAWNSATAFTTTPQEISITKAEGGKFYLHVLSIDNNNNKLETVSKAIEVDGPMIFVNTSSAFGKRDYMEGIGWTYTGDSTTGVWENGLGGGESAVSGIKYDFTNLSTLKLSCGKFIDNGYIKMTVTFGLVESKDSTEFIAYASGVNTGNLTVDVSDIKGEYYIKVMCTGCSSSGGYLCGSGKIWAE